MCPACAARLDGELTIYRAAELKPAILALLDRPGPLELELAGITELDCAGLQLLILAKREAAARGRALRLTGHSPAVLEALELANLAGAFGDPVVLVHGNQAA